MYFEATNIASTQRRRLLSRQFFNHLMFLEAELLLYTFAGDEIAPEIKSSDNFDTLCNRAVDIYIYRNFIATRSVYKDV